MRFMVIVKANKDSEAGIMPSEKLLAEMGQFNEELVKAGVLLAGEGLHPSSKGARVKFSGKTRTVVEGPFTETTELIAGFWLWKVKSKEEAIEWVKRCPNPHNGDSEIEIRQVFEAEDFGEEFTPELREQEERVRAQVQSHDRHGERKEREMQLQPYLFFEGRCEEAARFYEKAVGARIGRLLRFKDSPDQSLCDGVESNKVMHMTLQIGDQTIMASDGQCQGSQAYQGFALSLTVNDEAEAERRFSALAEGGQVTQPLMKTFFSPRFGMLTDRFGVSWMIHAAP